MDSCDLETVLLDPDALAMWPDAGEELYGGDPRHYDGGVFTIKSPKKGYLTVGELCREGAAECPAEHQALLRLRDAFTELSRQAESSAECEVLKN